MRQSAAVRLGAVLAGGKWMMPLHSLRQARALHMGVDLRCRNVGMAQHRLDRTQIGAAFEQVTGERVAQDVRRETRRIDSGGGRQLLEQLKQALAGQMAKSAAGRKQKASA